MSNSVKEYFENRAHAFDSIYSTDSWFHRFLNRRFRKAVYERFDITFAHSGSIEGKSVLDVGCGSGRYSVEYARRGANRVVGIDYSRPMLDIATKLATQVGVSDRCQFIEDDFSRFAPSEEFDIALAIGVFDYLSDPISFLRRMAKASRWRVIASFPGRSLIRMRLRQMRYRLSGCPVLFYSEEDVRRIAAAAGLVSFDIVPIRSSGTGFVLVGSVR